METLTTWTDRHFVSGVNDPGEVLGLALSGHWIGVTADRISKPLIAALAEFEGGGMRVFVDSGAFSEVKFAKDGTRSIVKPITHTRWVEILDLYRQVGAAVGARRCLVVAPDCVGDQVETMRRFATYREEIRQLVADGFQVIVPVQRGAMPLPAFWFAALDVLGLDQNQVIAGVPSRKGATTPDDVAELCGVLGLNARIHLLGMGTKSDRFEATIAAARMGCPWVEITMDSAAVRSEVGRKNGRGGTRRRLTRLQDDAREMGIEGCEVKRYALQKASREDAISEVQQARRNGWYDEELESAPGVPLEPGCIDYGPGGPFGDGTFPEAPEAAQEAQEEAPAAAPVERTVVLIGCCKEKGEAPAPARELYRSDLFRKSLSVAEKMGDQVLILSAEHGVVHPDQVLAPYDTTLRSFDPARLAEWKERVAAQLAEATGGARVRLVLLAGELYRPAVEVETPLAGMGIGARLGWLKRAAAPPTPRNQPPFAHSFGAC